MSKLLAQGRHKLVGQLLGQEVDITFLSVADVLALHDQVIGAFGGSNGTRDESLLESAVHRPMQAACYEDMDAVGASAMMGEAIIRNHAFLDGNKRSGFFSMVVMLDENGYDFIAEAADIIYMVKNLAAGTVTSEQFSQWVRNNSLPYEMTDRERPVGPKQN